MKINPHAIHDYIIQNSKPKLAFDESKDFNAWKKDLRQKFIELFGIDKIKQYACPLNYEIEEEKDCGAYKQLRIVYESEKGFFVPTYLLIPKTGNNKTRLAPAAKRRILPLFQTSPSPPQL